MIKLLKKRDLIFWTLVNSSISIINDQKLTINQKSHDDRARYGNLKYLNIALLLLIYVIFAKVGY